MLLNWLDFVAPYGELVGLLGDLSNVTMIVPVTLEFYAMVDLTVIDRQRVAARSSVSSDSHLVN